MFFIGLMPNYFFNFILNYLLKTKKLTMNNIKIRFVALFFLCVGFSSLQAQNAVPVAGGEASGQGGTASYTIGQIVYCTSKGTNCSVAQGVQQSYIISVETGIDRLKDISLTCTAYPNPTTDYLTLKIEDSTDSHLIATLYDINGRILMTKNTDAIETTIPMGTYVAGTYLLKIIKIDNALSNEIKTFTIIKK